MKRRWVIEIAVNDDGSVDATLLMDGRWPVEGHSDTTGTVAVLELVEPLMRRAAAGADGYRAVRIADCDTREPEAIP